VRYETRPHVDRAGRSRDGRAHGVVEAIRNAVRPDEVHAGAEGNRRDLRRGARTHQAVRRLVERAVAADRDDKLGAVARGLLGELDQMNPGRSENSVSPCRPSCVARCASSGQRFPVEPLLDAGLTREDGRARQSVA